MHQALSFLSFTDVERIRPVSHAFAQHWQQRTDLTLQTTSEWFVFVRRSEFAQLQQIRLSLPWSSYIDLTDDRTPLTRVPLMPRLRHFHVDDRPDCGELTIGTAQTLSRAYPQCQFTWPLTLLPANISDFALDGIRGDVNLTVLCPSHVQPLATWFAHPHIRLHSLQVDGFASNVLTAALTLPQTLHTLNCSVPWHDAAALRHSHLQFVTIHTDDANAECDFYAAFYDHAHVRELTIVGPHTAPHMPATIRHLWAHPAPHLLYMYLIHFPVPLEVWTACMASEHCRIVACGMSLTRQHLEAIRSATVSVNISLTVLDPDDLTL